MKPKMIFPFNDQIKSEFTASAQYIAIAVYFDDMGLVELANFFYHQSDEERMHAMKFIRFMLDSDAKPDIPGIPDLRNDFGSPADAVQFALDQERKVTEQIDNLVTLAINEGDHASHSFLQWFVTEQVEEVATMIILLQTIKLAGNNLLLVEDYVRRNPQHAGEAPAAT
ncbi:MAG: ferritin [Chloroflexi bacterium]|nr:ferritin [Chloroflexota bacterium]MCI0579124.1 ferritin [Chloroflexota bacterium]MCI0643341.1 ferritin [Chloroflexota bacterium]MCI0728320.1 ferritin [Chloroflexota bacterium]